MGGFPVPWNRFKDSLSLVSLEQGNKKQRYLSYIAIWVMLAVSELRHIYALTSGVLNSLLEALASLQ